MTKASALKSALGALCLTLLFHSPVLGATQYWTSFSGTSNNSWTISTGGSVPLNWSGSSGGTANQYWTDFNSAVIQSATPTIGIGGFGAGPVNVMDLTIQNGATFTTNAVSNVNRTLTILGSGTGNFTLQQQVAPDAAFFTRIAMSGSTAWSGTITLNGAISGTASGLFFTNTTGVGTNTKLNLQGGALWLADSLINKTVTIGQLSGTGGIKPFFTASTGARTLAINQVSTTTFSGLIQSGTNAADVLSITKAGSGTLTFANANTYTGTTTVSAGTLLVSNPTGSGLGTGPVDVKSGATLGGTGRIAPTGGNAILIEGGGTLLAGDGSITAATLTVAGDLALQDGSTIKMVLGPSLAHSTLARSSGSWSFDSDQAFAFTVLSGAVPGFYDNLITGLASNPWVSGISPWTILTPGVVGTFSWDGANVDLTLTSVPEPGSLLLLGTGLGFFLIFRRRRSEAC